MRLRNQNLSLASGVYGAFLLAYAAIAIAVDDGKLTTEVAAPAITAVDR